MTSEEKSREIRTEASNFLGREITDIEWDNAFPQAKKKLARIIAREGDANNERRQIWYIGKLVEEEIRANMAKEKTASEECGPFITELVYQKNRKKVNRERGNTYENSYATT